MTCSIVIDLEHDYTVEPVQAKVTFNDLELFHGVLKGQQTRLQFDMPSNPDLNTLRVHMLNRPDDGGTEVDTAGTILRDTFVNVKSIIVDKRKLKYMIFDRGLIKTRSASNNL